MTGLASWREQQRQIDEAKAIEEGAKQRFDHWVCDLCRSFDVADFFFAANHSLGQGHIVRSAEARQARRNLTVATQKRSVAAVIALRQQQDQEVAS